jgi:UPF0716 protein FxsA
MSFIKWVFIGLFMLPLAEIAAFLLIVHLTGWFWAIAVSIATSVAGVLLLRRTGEGELDGLWHAAAGRDRSRALHLGRPAAATMLAGILLVLPGFITDLLGAALLVRPFRQWLARTLAKLVRKRRRPSDRRMIDLEPGEWHQIPDRKGGRSRKS